MSARILWIASRLTSVGGGERLLFEGVRYFRQTGIDVHVATWQFDPRALFDGEYENKNIHVLANDHLTRSQLLARSVSRAATISRLVSLTREIRPNLILCQSEYDAILADLASRLTGVPFSVLIFGQTFQFPEDLAKYSLVFRRHLKEIVDSMEGYRETVSLRPPRASLANRVLNEVACIARYSAVRRARARFVFSEQVKWEVSRLYGASAHILKGAFRPDIVKFRSDSVETRTRFGVRPEQTILLTLHRLEPKKRTELAIRAFHAMNSPNSVLLIGGTGSETDRLRALIDKLRLQDQVRLLGYVAEADVWPLKQAADVFVNLDIADFDISPLEALALGSKAIWTTEIDMDDNLRACRNLFVTRPEVEAVARCMSLASSTPVVEERERYLRYTWDAYFQSIFERSSVQAG